ncbi:hypothetical protein AX15_007816 [Amanita polypyramis BW_CC]|nr:hypothetical protein AX15_007816 [Amanita polypyramis BW_CC]
MHEKLHATSSQFSLSISLFILIQGLMPWVWTTISEIKGRKIVYLVSLAMYTVASVAVALSPNMKCVIAFRCFQAAGSSAVMAIGATTLADIFDPEERGTKMGTFYMAPLLGPSLGPILGGALTAGFNWRAIFWFLSIVSGLSCISFLFFFRDTYRKERSLIYQGALKSRLKDISLSRTTTIGDDARSPRKATMTDVEKGETEVKREDAAQPDLAQVNVSLRDLSPFGLVWSCLRRLNNFTILLSSGISFAYNFMVTYIASRTLGFEYGYNPLKIGLVTLSFGIGCIAGSLLGGRWSDYSLAKSKKANGGVSYPEMRLKSTVLGVVAIPPLVAVLGWIWQKHVHIAAVCVFLFVNGFFYVWPYTSSLAYIVDSNKGRSSIAVAMNSAFRGGLAFIATEVAVPMQDNLGNGWMMTIWAFLMLFSGVLILLTYWKGKSWREKAELSEFE